MKNTDHSNFNPAEILDIQQCIRDIKDFPHEGILFKDISPLLADPVLFQKTVDLMCRPYIGKNIDKIAVIDARGFIFGTAMAIKMNAGIVPVRKAGKLPGKCHSQSYDLEYGQNTLEIHQDALAEGENVIIVDDLLATGGTAKAAADLIAKLGANVESIDFFAELKVLHGRKKLDGYSIKSILQF